MTSWAQDSRLRTQPVLPAQEVILRTRPDVIWPVKRWIEAKARCYRTEPTRWEQSGSVTPYQPDTGDGATEPDVYRDTSAPGSVNGLPTEQGSVDEDEVERLAARWQEWKP